MFLSKERDIVVPQSEHQKLAGVLARNWGNQDFSFPDIDRDSFDVAVATHDRAFGYLDTMAVGKLTSEDRTMQVNEWLDTPYENLNAELTVLLHVRRLMNTPEQKDLYQKLDNRIQEIIRNEDFNLEAYEQADTITDICDSIAFDFSFESPIEQTMTVYQNEDMITDITYRLAEGKITIDKWPFNVPVIKGYILGYHQAGYPNSLQPVLLSYEVVPV